MSLSPILEVKLQLTEATGFPEHTTANQSVEHATVVLLNATQYSGVALNTSTMHYPPGQTKSQHSGACVCVCLGPSLGLS